jgi:hypothetical protein
MSAPQATDPGLLTAVRHYDLMSCLCAVRGPEAVLEQIDGRLTAFEVPPVRVPDWTLDLRLDPAEVADPSWRIGAHSVIDVVSTGCTCATGTYRRLSDDEHTILTPRDPVSSRRGRRSHVIGVGSERITVAARDQHHLVVVGGQALRQLVLRSIEGWGGGSVWGSTVVLPGRHGVLIVGEPDAGTAAVTELLEAEFGAYVVCQDRTALLPAVSSDWIAVGVPLSCTDCGESPTWTPRNWLPTAKITEVVRLRGEPGAADGELVDDQFMTDWLGLRRHMLAMQDPAQRGGWWQRLATRLPVRQLERSGPLELARQITAKRPS